MRLKGIHYLCAALTLTTTCMVVRIAHAGPEPESAKQYAILDAKHGPRLLDQCSRDAPTGIKVFFTPPEALVQEAEVKLKEYFSEPVPKAPTFNQKLKSTIDLSRYVRQYVGYRHDGHQYLYVNAFRGILRPIHETGPVRGCDGGKVFWGIVYSIDQKQLIQFSVNGG